MDGNANDSVGGHNGILTSLPTVQNPAPLPTWSTDKKVGAKSISYADAQGQAVGYVSIPASSAFNLGTGDFTISFWVKTPGKPNVGNGYISESYLITNDLSIAVSASGVGATIAGVSMAALTDITGQTSSGHTYDWHLITWVRRSGNVVMYLDSSQQILSLNSGTPQLSYPVTGSVNAAGQGIILGALTDHTLPAIGRQDDVRIYKRALSEDDIMALYNLGGGDQNLPVVTLTAPTPDASVLGTAVPLTASVTDNIQVGGVTFKIDSITNPTVGGSEVTPPSPTKSAVLTRNWDTSITSDPSFGNGSHTVYAIARDKFGNTSTTSVSVTVNNDLDPPVITSSSPSGTITANTTLTSLQITTNKNATCKYGTAAPTGQTALAQYTNLPYTFGVTGGTNHGARIVGLSNNTTYHYYVRCEVTNLNPNTSDYVITFTVAQDNKPPVISNIDTSHTTQNSVRVNWATTELTTPDPQNLDTLVVTYDGSTSQVEYGTTASYGTTTTLNPALVTYHAVALSGLSPNTTYHFRVRSKDISNNEALSSDQTFKTATVIAGNHVYISRMARGLNTGADCANSHSIDWFGSILNGVPTNWWAQVKIDRINGNAPKAGDILAGDTVHFCGPSSGYDGIINKTDPATGLGIPVIVPGSGLPGNPVTILFDRGAKMSAPAWQGTPESTNIVSAIYISGRSNIILDGGTLPNGSPNGIVETTDNGTPARKLPTGVTSPIFGHSLPNIDKDRPDPPWSAISMQAGVNCEIKNLIVRGTYTRVAGSSDAAWAGAISAEGSHLKIYNNILTDCGNCMGIGASGNSGYDSDIEIYKNTIQRMSVGINLSTNASREGQLAAWGDNISIHDNDMSDTYNWTGDWPPYGPWDHNHNNGIHVFANQHHAMITNLKVFNNYVHGDWTPAGNATAFFYIEMGEISNNNFIFNNLLVNKSTDNSDPSNGFIVAGGTASKIFNNTTIGKANGGCEGASPYTYIYNNICNHTAGTGVSTYGSEHNNSFQEFIQYEIMRAFTDVDYNIYNPLDLPNFFMGDRRFGYGEMTNWQNMTGFDTHSQIVDPQLDSNYRPTASSTSVIGKAKNLTEEFCDLAPELCFDRTGMPRPSTGPWDIGAFQFSSVAIVDTTKPSIPSFLNISNVTASSLRLYWNASTDNVKVSSYKIFRCVGTDCVPKTVVGTSTTASFNDTSLNAGTSYTYAVSAIDSSTNESAHSAIASATTSGSASSAPRRPTSPTNLRKIP